MYWGYKNNDIKSNFWYALTYMTQFRITRHVSRYLSSRYKSAKYIKLALKLYKLFKPLSRIRYFQKKGRLVLKGYMG
jgi:hypothetical protein